MYNIKNAENFKTGYVKALDYIERGLSESDCSELETDHDILQGIHAAYYENIKKQFVDSVSKLVQEGTKVTDSTQDIVKRVKLLNLRTMNLKKLKDSWDRFQTWAFDLVENGYVDIPVLNKEDSTEKYDQVCNALEAMYRETGDEAPEVDFTVDEDKMHIFITE